ncbi:MAG TPA: ATP-binding cassette domain-containing protein [Haloplasmataceae bacterium]
MIDITLNNVTKNYGQNRGVFNIDFKINKGEIFGFVGTNGSGKTTTIRQIMGFIKPNAGNIDIRGKDAYKQATETKEYTGYVPGEIAFPDLRTGFSFIKSQAEFWQIKDLSYVDELIKILQIDLRANPRKMSKGMKQKTAIIAALMNDSDILILDEPTNGLDPLMRKKFLDILEKEKAKGKTILISSHVFQELEELCDKVALIKDGKIIDIVAMADIRNPKIREFKIEFMDKLEFDQFKKLPYKFIRIKENLNQVIIKVKIEDIKKLFQDLSPFKLKFIAENKYNLEKYFKEKFNRLVEGDEIDDK